MAGMKIEIWDEMNNEPAPVQFFGAEALRVTLEDYAATTTALLWALQTRAEAEESSNWQPHIAQMRAAVAQFQKLCRNEIEKIGLWREDGPDPEEVHEMIWNEGDRLVGWLRRIIGTNGKSWYSSDS